MKKIKQTTNDNCFQACIAMLLDLDINDVPEFFSGGKEWDSKKQGEWLKRKGYYALEVELIYDEETEGKVNNVGGWDEGSLMILTGESPNRPNLLHAVIGVGNKEGGIDYKFDPHKSNSFLKGKPKYITFLVARFPYHFERRKG